MERHISDAQSKGADVVVGGSRVSNCADGSADNDEGGHFYKPTVLTNVSNDMLVCNEETFGPVAPIMK